VEAKNRQGINRGGERGRERERGKGKGEIGKGEGEIGVEGNRHKTVVNRNNERETSVCIYLLFCSAAWEGEYLSLPGPRGWRRETPFRLWGLLSHC
jgi:hypothetical protein